MALTDRQIKTAKVPEGLNQIELRDDQVRGLLLRVYAGGARTWMLAYRIEARTGATGVAAAPTGRPPAAAAGTPSGTPKGDEDRCHSLETLLSPARSPGDRTRRSSSSSRRGLGKRAAIADAAARLVAAVLPVAEDLVSQPTLLSGLAVRRRSAPAWSAALAIAPHAVSDPWEARPKCLFVLARESARPPRFPIGARVEIVTIKRDRFDGSGQVVALLRIGEGGEEVDRREPLKPSPPP